VSSAGSTGMSSPHAGRNTPRPRRESSADLDTTPRPYPIFSAVRRARSGSLVEDRARTVVRKPPTRRRPMLVRTLVLIALATSLGCTAHESDETSKPAPRTTKPDPKPDPKPAPQLEPQPEPEPEPEAVLAKASISSVTMIQDCPDEPPPKPKPSAATEARDRPPAGEPAPPEAMEVKRSAAKVAPGA